MTWPASIASRACSLVATRPRRTSSASSRRRVAVADLTLLGGRLGGGRFAVFLAGARFVAFLADCPSPATSAAAIWRSSRAMSALVARPRLPTCARMSLRTCSSRRSVFWRLRSNSSVTAAWAWFVWSSPALTRSLTMASARACVIWVNATPASRKRLRRLVSAMRRGYRSTTVLAKVRTRRARFRSADSRSTSSPSEAATTSGSGFGAGSSVAVTPLSTRAHR